MLVGLLEIVDGVIQPLLGLSKKGGGTLSRITEHGCADVMLNLDDVCKSCAVHFRISGN